MSILLAAIGIGVMFTRPHHQTNCRSICRFPSAPILFVIGAPIVFAMSVRSLGLVAALVLSIAMSVAASHKMTFTKGLLIVVGMTLFCVAVFSYGHRPDGSAVRLAAAIRHVIRATAA